MAKSNSFGIKEVADVKFYPVGTVFSNFTDEGYDAKDGTTSTAETVAPTYTFDSLKVSNIEVSSEETSARGGKGNPELISWSYGKEVTFTMEDALFSLDTLDLMFGAKEADGTGGVLTIDANTFPTAYSMVGKTVMRSYATGKDEPFYFVIPKGQVQVGGTLTMEAEGDPSTFEMTIKALSATLDGSEDMLVKFISPISNNGGSEEEQPAG